MKSHSCEKPIGGGVSPASQDVSQSQISQLQPPQRLTTESLPEILPAHLFQPPTIQPRTSVRCRHIDRLNRNCRLFSSSPDSELCPHHARQLRARNQRHNDKDAAELLGDLTNFSTPEAVNFLLGNLVRQLARKRIARLDAMAIAYVSQLLLGSISSMDRHDAALRAAEDATTDNFPTRIVFDRPAELDATATPISDSAKIAALFATHPAQESEGRA